MQSNKEDIQNTGPSVSSEAKTEATTSTELSDSQSDVAGKVLLRQGQVCPCLA